jgi:hypothetical protein
MAVLASGLSMMIFKPPAIGVAAVFGSDELAGVALALPLALTEALADADAVGDPLSRTKLVVLSPPQPASEADASPTNRTTPNPFITLSNGSAALRLRETLCPRWPGRAHYSSRS